MRRLTGFFVIALTSSIAWGQPARSPEPKSVASIPGIPLQVVQTLPKTHQAVVFEKNRATHVLIEVGGTIDGFRVDAITDTQVILSVRGSQIALTAPKRPAPVLLTPTTSSAPVDPYAGSSTTSPVDPYAGSTSPVDPYGEPEIHTATATDVRTAEAPAAAPPVATAAPAPTVATGPAPTVASAPAPGPTAPTTTTTTTTTATAAPTTATPAPATTTTTTTTVAAAPAPTTTAPTSTATAPPTTAPASTTPAPAVTTPTVSAAPAPTVATVPAPTVATTPAPTITAPAPAPTTTPAPAISAPSVTPTPRSNPGADLASAATGSTMPVGPTASDTKLTRTEVRVALADFGRLTSAIRGEFTPVGAKIDGVTARSVFAKVGLKTGDIVTAVDGKPILTIDDAAELYSRATTARNITVSVLRAGKPATLKVSIQ